MIESLSTSRFPQLLRSLFPLQLSAGLLFASGVLLFSTIASASDGTPPNGLVHDFNPSKSTLLHIIRVHRIDDWKREFLQTYIDNAGPPKEWIRVGPWHGVTVNDMPRVNLETLSYETIIRHWSYYANLSENEYQRRRSEQKFSYIVFAANPKEGSKWLVAGPQDPPAKAFRRNWWLNPGNWFRTNDFFFSYLIRMWSDWRMPFRHISDV
jgi:hypothetical protein